MYEAWSALLWWVDSNLCRRRLSYYFKKRRCPSINKQCCITKLIGTWRLKLRVFLSHLTISHVKNLEVLWCGLLLNTSLSIHLSSFFTHFAELNKNMFPLVLFHPIKHPSPYPLFELKYSIEGCRVARNWVAQVFNFSINGGILFPC